MTNSSGGRKLAKQQKNLVKSTLNYYKELLQNSPPIVTTNVRKSTTTPAAAKSATSAKSTKKEVQKKELNEKCNTKNDCELDLVCSKDLKGNKICMTQSKADAMDDYLEKSLDYMEKHSPSIHTPPSSSILVSSSVPEKDAAAAVFAKNKAILEKPTYTYKFIDTRKDNLLHPILKIEVENIKPSQVSLSYLEKGSYKRLVYVDSSKDNVNFNIVLAQNNDDYGKQYLKKNLKVESTNIPILTKILEDIIYFPNEIVDEKGTIIVDHNNNVENNKEIKSWIKNILNDDIRPIAVEKLAEIKQVQDELSSNIPSKGGKSTRSKKKRTRSKKRRRPTSKKRKTTRSKKRRRPTSKKRKNNKTKKIRYTSKRRRNSKKK